MAIFAGQGTTKSHNFKVFKFQYLSEFLRYGPDVLHVIINFIGLKITLTIWCLAVLFHLFQEGGQMAPCAFSSETEMSPMIGLTVLSNLEAVLK